MAAFLLPLLALLSTSLIGRSSAIGTRWRKRESLQTGWVQARYGRSARIGDRFRGHSSGRSSFTQRRRDRRSLLDGASAEVARPCRAEKLPHVVGKLAGAVRSRQASEDLAPHVHGKEGVNGSSPLEGLQEAAANGRLLLPSCCSSGRQGSHRVAQPVPFRLTYGSVGRGSTSGSQARDPRRPTE
jgi:hypothetical protein